MSSFFISFIPLYIILKSTHVYYDISFYRCFWIYLSVVSVVLSVEHVNYFYHRFTYRTLKSPKNHSNVFSPSPF